MKLSDVVLKLNLTPYDVLWLGKQNVLRIKGTDEDAEVADGGVQSLSENLAQIEVPIRGESGILLNVRDATSILGVGRSSVRCLYMSNIVKAVRVNGELLCDKDKVFRYYQRLYSALGRPIKPNTCIYTEEEVLGKLKLWGKSALNVLVGKGLITKSVDGTKYCYSCTNNLARTMLTRKDMMAKGVSEVLLNHFSINGAQRGLVNLDGLWFEYTLKLFRNNNWRVECIKENKIKKRYCISNDELSLIKTVPGCMFKYNGEVLYDKYNVQLAVSNDLERLKRNTIKIKLPMGVLKKEHESEAIKSRLTVLDKTGIHSDVEKEIVKEICNAQETGEEKPVNSKESVAEKQVSASVEKKVVEPVKERIGTENQVDVSTEEPVGVVTEEQVNVSAEEKSVSVNGDPVKVEEKPVPSGGTFTSSTEDVSTKDVEVAMGITNSALELQRISSELQLSLYDTQYLIDNKVIKRESDGRISNFTITMAKRVLGEFTKPTVLGAERYITPQVIMKVYTVSVECVNSLLNSMLIDMQYKNYVLHATFSQVNYYFKRLSRLDDTREFTSKGYVLDAVEASSLIAHLTSGPLQSAMTKGLLTERMGRYNVEEILSYAEYDLTSDDLVRAGVTREQVDSCRDLAKANNLYSPLNRCWKREAIELFKSGSYLKGFREEAPLLEAYNLDENKVRTMLHSVDFKIWRIVKDGKGYLSEDSFKEFMEKNTHYKYYDISLKQASDLLGMTQVAVKKLIKSNALESVLIGSVTYLNTEEVQMYKNQSAERARQVLLDSVKSNGGIGKKPGVTSGNSLSSTRTDIKGLMSQYRRLSSEERLTTKASLLIQYTLGLQDTANMLGVLPEDVVVAPKHVLDYVVVKTENHIRRLYRVQDVDSVVRSANEYLAILQNMKECKMSGELTAKFYGVPESYLEAIVNANLLYATRSYGMLDNISKKSADVYFGRRSVLLDIPRTASGHKLTVDDVSDLLGVSELTVLEYADETSDACIKNSDLWLKGVKVNGRYRFDISTIENVSNKIVMLGLSLKPVIEAPKQVETDEKKPEETEDNGVVISLFNNNFGEKVNPDDYTISRPDAMRLFDISDPTFRKYMNNNAFKYIRKGNAIFLHKENMKYDLTGYDYNEETLCAILKKSPTQISRLAKKGTLDLRIGITGKKRYGNTSVEKYMEKVK